MGNPSFHELMGQLFAGGLSKLTPADRFAELAPQIGALPMVRRAEGRTANWVVWNGTDVDVDATLQFLGQLGNPAFRVTRRFGGGTTTTLATACGITVGVVHPNTLAEIIGKDQADVDWAGQPPALLGALVWAHATNHPSWPASCDDYVLADEVVGVETLPPRWQRIVDDFALAALNFSVQATPETLALIRLWSGGRAGTQQAPSQAPAPGPKFVINASNVTGLQVGDGNRSTHHYW